MPVRALILALLLLAGLVPRAEAAPEVRAVRLAHGFVNEWALVGDGGTVLVDAGYPGHAKRILRDLQKAGVAPDTVKLILLTHGHADHAGSAEALHDALGAPVAVGEGDVHLLRNGHDDPLVPTGLAGRLVRPFIGKKFPPFEPDMVVYDHLDLSPFGVPGVARVVGGHTAGSLVVRLPGGRVVCGDLVRGRILAHHHTTTHFFQDDEEGAIKAVIHLLHTGATAFLPGHGDVLQAADVNAWLRRHAPILGATTP